MKKKMIQLRRYYTGCFFTLALISCGTLSNQAKRQPREAESTEERKSVRPQRNNMLSGIFNRQTFIMALLAASQIQLGSSTENANIIKKIDLTQSEPYIFTFTLPVVLNKNFTDEYIRDLIRSWVCNYAEADPLYVNHIMVTDEEYRSGKHMNITTECSKTTSAEVTSECKQICLNNLKSVFNKASDKSKDQTGSHVTIHDIPDQGYKTNGRSGQALTKFNYPNYTFVHTNSSGQNEYYALYKSLQTTRCKQAHCPYTYEIDYVSTFDVIREKCSDPDLNPEALKETFQELMEEILADKDGLTIWCETPGHEDVANAVITRVLHLHRGVKLVEKTIEFQKGFEEFLNTRNDEPTALISSEEDNGAQDILKLTSNSQRALRKQRQIEEKFTQRSKQNWKNSFLSHNSKQRKASFRYH